LVSPPIAAMVISPGEPLTRRMMASTACFRVDLLRNVRHLDATQAEFPVDEGRDR